MTLIISPYGTEVNVFMSAGVEKLNLIILFSGCNRPESGPGEQIAGQKCLL
jgi:hypothetical protein